MVKKLLEEFEKKKIGARQKLEMAIANFQRWVVTQIWGRDKQGAKCTWQGWLRAQLRAR